MSMRCLLFIMALLLLAGCHSQRHSTEHTLNADITAPRVVAAHAAEVDSAAADIVAVNESRQMGDNEQQRELTAVARPGAGTIILWLIAAVALAAVLYWLRHKIRNPP